MSDEELERFQEVIDFGAQAKSLKSNAAFKALMAAIKGGVITQFGQTDFDEVKHREHLFRLTKTIDLIDSFIEASIAEGRIRKDQLDQLLTEVN